MIRFHNAVVADVTDDLGSSMTKEEIFTEAQRIVRWHYQWVIVHEFLPKTCGADVVDGVLENGRQFYKWRNEPYIPVEFSVGAYRFGHSQIRPSYRANFGHQPDVEAFIPLIFDPRKTGGDPDDLRGGCRAPRRFIDWQTFFDFGDGNHKPNKTIDTTLSSVLFNLMGMDTGTPVSLAQRNLIRNLVMRLPSGQRVAKAMNLPVLDRADLADLTEQDLDRRTPLWFYVLREAQVTAQAHHLGPVGGTVVAEVILGLLEGDPSSYLRQDPEWLPTYGTDDDFTMVDLLTKAGVVHPL